ncbi:hypothetical protein GTQ34_16385 [Muricauda sp. JGD-17]|uniref:Uncharacterized protein n=1 Tax=Flagellimonas ochracea TaxID=2696472 RepID=A0A964WYR1_9FLAO|nr:hypothetical protein [Allomuricauda ochracea]NAY93491.1 hypothetical protein [Allomuricauda ochracea]
MSKILKNKVTLLISGFLLLLFLCHKLAISKTIEARKDYLSSKSNRFAYEDTYQNLSALNKKEVHLDSILRRLDHSGTSIENNLLREINKEADKNGLMVIDFNPAHVFKIDDTSYKTFNFILRGDFISILKSIHYLEMKSSFGQIIHMNFVKNKDNRTSKFYLEATIFIQTLE